MLLSLEDSAPFHMISKSRPDLKEVARRQLTNVLILIPDRSLATPNTSSSHHLNLETSRSSPPASALEFPSLALDIGFLNIQSAI